MKKSSLHRIVELFIAVALLAVLFGKITVSIKDSELGLLIFYGITVTIAVWLVFFFAFVIYKDPYVISKNKLRGTKRKNYFISCMVAVHNEEKNISRCIASILAQSYKNKEVIVVNDASTDNTKKALKEYEKKGLIKLIDLRDNLGKKKALGRAMMIAKGDIFAFTDSDSIWARDAIKKIVTIFQANEDVGAVSGHCRALNGDQNLMTRIQDSWYEGQYSIRKASESIWGAVTCVSGPLAVFRREAVFNYISAWENDSFLKQEFKFATDRMLTGLVLGGKSIGKKLKEKYKDFPCVKKKIDYPERDWKIVYSKSARSWTIVPDTFKKVVLQQIRWKKSFIRNIFFTGLFYWRRPLLPVLMYYFHILFIIAGPFIVFRHLIYLPISGNPWTAPLYLSGIVFIGFMFGLAYKLENKKCSKWMYRPLMSLLSTLVFTWLIFYSALTIRRMIWIRG